jgi:glycosyltransferase involved in cell wall biosynthesis
MISTRSIAVVVPTYRRAGALRSCLDALASQLVAPDEVIVVCRREDDETLVALREHNPCGARVVFAEGEGTARAVAAGARATSADVIAFTDDDASPPPNWVSLLLAAFADDGLGAIGGPDRLDPPQADMPTEDVGRIGQWGKLHGNHHRASGPRRDVDVLKGVNMAFRREALFLPVGLRGPQTQLHYEVAMGMAARRAGWQVVFDPELVVDHAPRPRRPGEHRARPEPGYVRDMAYNLVGCMLAAQPALAVRRALFGLIVGDRAVPGVVRGLAAIARREEMGLHGIAASLLGQVSALAQHATGRGIRLVPLDQAHRAERSLRVAMVAHDVHDDGGMERVMAHLVRHASTSVSIDVISRTLSPQLRPLVRWHRVSIPSRPFALKFAAFFVLAGLRLRRMRPDVVHTVGAIVPNHADIASVHFSHTAFVADGRRLTPPGLSPVRHFNRALARMTALAAERWVYRPSRVGILAAVSPGIADDMRRFHPGVAVAVTPNGVDLEVFRPSPEERAAVRREYGVDDSETVVLFVGGDWNRKGLDLLIEAVAQLSSDVRLWVVGPGDTDRFAALAAGASVDFFGVRRDTSRFYAAADVFALPSLAEAAPLAAYEAAASALPIVATRVHGVTELVGTDEAAGILVDRRAAAIASALERLAVNPQLRRAMGEEARRRAAGYSWEQSAESVVELYRRIAASKEAA